MDWSREDEFTDYEQYFDERSLFQPMVDPRQVREKVHLTLSLKWLVETKKRKTALQMSLQCWFCHFTSKVDCSVQEILPDGGAVITVTPPPGFSELQKLSGETLLNKGKTEFVTVLSVSLGKLKQDPQTAADASDKVLVEEQKKPVSTAGDSPGEIQNMPETCVLSVIQYLYVSHIYKEELRVIENEYGVEIKPEVTVKFEALRKNGKPIEASSKFTDLVLKCFLDSNGSTFTLKSVQPDQLSSALKFIMNKENKLLATMSSEETTVIGPSGSRDALGLMLNSTHKSINAIEEYEWMSGSQSNNDVCLKISMTIKDDLADAGLTIGKTQWKNLISFDHGKLALINEKFNVDFQQSSISEEQVNIKASYKESGGNPAMESHAVRALLRLYQKMMMSPLPLPSDYGATGFSGSEVSSGVEISVNTTPNINTASEVSQGSSPSVVPKTTVSEQSAGYAVIQNKVIPGKHGNPFTATPKTLSPKVRGAAQESCLLPLNHYWHMSHVYREGIKQIERENKIKIVAQVHVTFEVEQKDGTPYKALSEFIDLSQSCSTESGEMVIPLKFVDPDQWSDALQVLKKNKAKLLLNMSSEEVSVSGPKQSQEEFSKALNAI